MPCLAAISHVIVALFDTVAPDSRWSVCDCLCVCGKCRVVMATEEAGGLTESTWVGAACGLFIDLFS